MPLWPNLFIAGAPRCGTSSLDAYLRGIPGIFMSRIKEPNYFARTVIPDDHPMLKPIRDQKQYLQLFAGAGDARFRGEASPTYLEDPEAADQIKRVSPDARFIVSLRDPVERLHSHYLMMMNNRRSMGSFVEEVRKGVQLQDNRSLGVLGPDVGLYHSQLQRVQSVLGKDRVKVLIFEEYTADVPAALRQVLDFLGITHSLDDFAEPAHRQFSEARGPLVRFLFGTRTISLAAEAIIPPRMRKMIRDRFLVKQVPKPELDPEAREFLKQYYADDVRRLAELLGRPLPWSNFF